MPPIAEQRIGWQELAAAHGMVPSDERVPILHVVARMTGTVGGVALDAMMFRHPEGTRIGYVRFTARAMQERRGLMTVRRGLPVFVRGHLRVLTGDKVLDEALQITASDPATSARLFDESTRKTLHYFATRPFWIVDEDGLVKMQWRDLEPPFRTLDAALQVVLALCRVRTDAPYR